MPNREAEQCVLGSMLLDRSCIAGVREILTWADFTAPEHWALYMTLEELHGRGDPVDIQVVAEELKAKGYLEVVGGVAALARLMETVPSAEHAQDYARLVRAATEV